jgi:hypothetical protein
MGVKLKKAISLAEAKPLHIRSTILHPNAIHANIEGSDIVIAGLKLRYKR